MSSTITAGFIDLATYDEPETHLYGGGEAITYFVRQHCRSTWFTLVPTSLSKCSGQPCFNSEWSVNISRAGDYLVHSWLRVCIPEIAFTQAPPPPQQTILLDPQSGLTQVVDIPGKWTLRWCRNLLHNLVASARLTFNDLQAQELNSFVFDCERAFGLTASKTEAYDNMIGDVQVLNGGVEYNPDKPNKLPAAILNLPLNFFFSRDTGVALPTAALPYNEMKFCFTFRDWSELLVMEFVPDKVPNKQLQASPGHFTPSIPVKQASYIGNNCPLLKADVYAHYAIVANEERQRMAAGFRDILIEQYQFNHKCVWDPCNSSCQFSDIRFSHPVKTLWFSVKNVTNPNDHSNYGLASYVPHRVKNEHHEHSYLLETSPELQADPLEYLNILYENTARVAMNIDYYALVNPYYHAVRIPTEHGYHMYSYSAHNYKDLDPKGSTNYGKLTNVSLQFKATQEAQDAANAAKISEDQKKEKYGDVKYRVRSGVVTPQKYECHAAVINHNIVRVAGGVLGFPVM